MRVIFTELCRRMPWVLLTTLIAGLGFTWVQVVFADWGEIGTWIGTQIVQRGGYPEKFIGPVGWTVHLAISFSYALLVASILALPFFPKSAATRLVSMLIVALALGWITTIITTPAIEVTVSLLSGSGFPTEIPGLNFKIYLALWNHIAFFVVSFLLVGVLADCFGPNR